MFLRPKDEEDDILELIKTKQGDCNPRQYIQLAYGMPSVNFTLAQTHNIVIASSVLSTIYSTHCFKIADFFFDFRFEKDKMIARLKEEIFNR